MEMFDINNIGINLQNELPLVKNYVKMDMSFMQGLCMQNSKITIEEVIHDWPYEIGYVKSKRLWRTDVPDATKKDGRRQITARSEAALNDKMMVEWQKQFKTVKEYFYQFLDERVQSGQIKKNTWERMDVSFRKSCGSIADRTLESIIEDDITQLMENICSSRASLSEYKNARNCIKKFFLWAKRHKYTDVNISDALAMAQISPKKQCKSRSKSEEDEVWLDSELKIVIPHLVSDKEDLRACAFYIAFASGLRIGEYSSLKGKDLSDKTITIYRSEHKYKKECGKGYDYVVEEIADENIGNKALKTDASRRVVVIPTEAQWFLRYLKSITPNNEYVFRNKNGERYTSCALRSFWHDYLAKLGLKYKKPHAIRKTYASILLDNNADEKFVITQSGHTDISTTEDFYHKDRKGIDKKVAILDAMDEFKVFGEVTQGHTITNIINP